jgi:plasmid maintenance system antidote protein VapI
MPAGSSLISDHLRQAILAYGSAYSLAGTAGVDRATISRFLAGKSALSLETVDRLAEVLGLRLVQSRAVRRAKKR